MIYLDNAATTPMSKEVKAAILDKIDCFGNPSTKSSLGAAARSAIEEARAACAKSINADPNEIYFTSGGTEADNWAISSGVGIDETCEGEIALITSGFEHKAILERARYMQCRNMRVEYLPIKSSGIVDYTLLDTLLSTNRVRMVSIMMVNNELGTIQPIKWIADVCRKHGVLFHTDAVQAYGKTEIDVKHLGVDMLSVSGHKVHAPKGVGFLYCRDGVSANPLIFGGGQERGSRSGTENTLGIVGLGEAAKHIPQTAIAHDCYKRYENCVQTCHELKKRCPEFCLNVRDNNSSFYIGILNFNVGTVDGAGLVSLLDSEGVIISNGSACDTKAIRPSHVLKAIGLSDDIAMSSFRVSLSGEETREEIEYFAEKFAECYYRLKRIEEVNNNVKDV